MRDKCTTSWNIVAFGSVPSVSYRHSCLLWSVWNILELPFVGVISGFVIVLYRLRYRIDNDRTNRIMFLQTHNQNEPVKCTYIHDH